MKIFDVYVAESTSSSIVVVEDQSYIVAAQKNLLVTHFAGSAVGDKIVLPLFDNVFKYAWIGDTDCSTRTGSLPAGTLYGNGEELSKETSYTWKIKVYEPGNGQPTIFDFGNQTSKYFSQGTYRVEFVMLIGSDTNPYPYGPTITVEIKPASDGLWFDTSRTVVDTKYQYRIYFSVDSAYWNILEEDFLLTTSNPKVLEIVEIDFLNRFCVVKGKKEGTATLQIEASGARSKFGTGQGRHEFVSSLKISVNKEETKNNKGIIITIWVIFGGTLLAVGFFGIWSIVKSNKMPVK